MQWVNRANTYRTDSYVIVRTIRGFELWVKDAHRFQRVAQDILTLDQAKAFAQRHQSQQREIA